MARLVAEEGSHLDVATGGELHVALHAGFPPERIVFHGNNKSTAELRAALDAGVGRIVADSFDELDRLEALVADGLRRAARARPRHARRRGAHPRVHRDRHRRLEVRLHGSRTATRSPRSRGSSTSDALRLRRACTATSARRSSGSTRSRAAVDRWSGSCAPIETETGATVDELNLGGGLGVRYLADDDGAVDRASTRRRCSDVVRQGARRRTACDRGPRSWSSRAARSPAPAGLTLYRVGTIKDDPGRAHLRRGRRRHERQPAARSSTAPATRRSCPAGSTRRGPLVVTIAGKHCEQGDISCATPTCPADVAVGDLLATPVTGAYGYSMASNYNKVPAPGGRVRATTARRGSSCAARRSTTSCAST